MKLSNSRTVSALVIVAGFFFTGSVTAQENGNPATTLQKNIETARDRMNEVISTKDFQEELLLAKFLKMVGKQLSKEKNFTIRLDHQAFDKDADSILKKEIVLPPAPLRMTANTALRLALSQAAPDRELEFTAGRAELVITTRDRSLFTATYEIRDLLQHTRYLHNSIPADQLGILPVFFLHSFEEPAFPGYDLKADPSKPAEWIVRQLVAFTNVDRAGWRNRTPASTIRVVNGTKLVVHTAPSVHAEIGSVLNTFRRLADLAVVMDAKLFAVDRADYDKHFAQSFVDPKNKSARRLIANVTKTQWNLLEALMPIQESDPEKLRPYERTVFLTRKNVYQYQAQPGAANPATAFEGFSFAVRPTVSADRRCLRLEFWHEVEQLVKLTKGTKIDLKTGKELPIELPNVRKSAATGTIDIHDTQSIMLAVDYRPEDKVWLLVAAPRIYIEEEEEQIRKGAIKPMLLADEKPPPEPVEPEPVVLPPVPLPNTVEMRQLLQAVVARVMTDPELKKLHITYGTPAEKKYTLIQGSEIDWPKEFQPVVPGYSFQPFDPDECHSFKKRILGIRIDRYVRTQKAGAAPEVMLDVVLDDAIHGVLGACHVIFHARPDGKRWKVEWSEFYSR